MMLAPNLTASRFDQDDFVTTISDGEDNVPDFESFDTETTRVAQKELGSTGTKRKRKDSTRAKGASLKRAKRHEGNAAAASYDADVPAPSSENEDDFDSEFEFKVGGVDEPLTLARSGWYETDGEEHTDVMSLEDIIERRRTRLTADTAKDRPIILDGEQADDIPQRVLPQTGAESEDEQTTLSSDESYESAADHEEHQIEDEDRDASPVAHPDDLSDVGVEDEEVETEETRKQREAFFAPEDKTDTSMANFQAMSLSRPILRGLNNLGFTSPTPIQAKTIPVALLGQDVVGGAVTGSGKTAAFVIPILERLLYRPKKVPITRVAILTPTRELAVQCHSVATRLAAFTDITFALIVGGLSLREQEQTLKKRPDVVIATPGRFIDHMRNSASFVLESLEILVLDEADRMLEDGFADELNEILRTIPQSRQTMLFSATMTNDVDQLVRAGLKRPARLMVDANKQTVKGLVQEFIKMKGQAADEELRLAYLLKLCTEVYTSKTIVFFPRKSLAHRVRVLASLNGVKAAELHGSMSQEQRLKAIADFQQGACTHLLATDLASRGLDIPRVETVINFTVPTTTTVYLHRVGRTARAGKSGVSCTLFNSAQSTDKSGRSDRSSLRPILRLARTDKAICKTRNLPPLEIQALVRKIRDLQPEIDAILLEEKEERVLQQTERDVRKGENMVKFEQEIAGRPKRTWFQSEKEKQASSQLGKEERTGAAPTQKKEKRRLSGKERKRLLNHDERVGGQNTGWKKGKEERAGRGVLQQKKSSKSKSKVKAKSGPSSKKR